MRYILKCLCFFTLFIFIFLYIIFYKDTLSGIVLNTILLWIKNIVPVLFPTFILSDLLFNSNIPFYLYKYFHLNYILLFSVLFGSPSNAYLISNYNVNYDKYLSVTKYTSLIFIYSMLSRLFNLYTTLVLILVNILCNFILIKFIKLPKIDLSINSNKFNLIESVNRSFSVLVSILGILIFTNLLPIFLIHNEYIKLFLYSITEITTFFNYLNIYNVSYYIKILFSIIAISSCGISIELQIKSIITDTSINYYKYRLIHFILYLLICIMLLY